MIILSAATKGGANDPAWQPALVADPQGGMGVTTARTLPAPGGSVALNSIAHSVAMQERMAHLKALGVNSSRCCLQEWKAAA